MTADYPNEFLLDVYERMVLIRQFEERVKLLFLEGQMPGTIHQCQGQEGSAVGVCMALNADDYITSTHRPHGHALAKGLSAEEMMIELFGKGTGCCQGKGGSMHMGNIAKGMVPAIAIVGGGIPLAAGMGLGLSVERFSTGHGLMTARNVATQPVTVATQTRPAASAFTGPITVEGPVLEDVEVALLEEIESALVTRRVRELSALDDLTPEQVSISLRMR